MTTGQKLRMLRDHRGLSQQALVETLNEEFGFDKPLSRDMYANYENDRNEFPWAYGRAFVHFFGVSLDELILEERKLPAMRSLVRRRHLVA